MLLQAALAVLLLWPVAFAATPAVAADASGDSAAGRLVALRVCAACHGISARETW